MAYEQSQRRKEPPCDPMLALTSPRILQSIHSNIDLSEISAHFHYWKFLGTKVNLEIRCNLQIDSNPKFGSIFSIFYCFQL